MNDPQKIFDDKWQELQNESWKEIKAKLDSLLLSTNYNSQNLSEFCNILNNVDHEQRVQMIESNWGANFCLSKAMPLLLQLKYIEDQ
jgi:hypothetical protein